MQAKRDADRIAAWKELWTVAGEGSRVASVEGADPLEMDEVRRVRWE